MASKSPRGDTDDTLPVQVVLVLHFKGKVNVWVAVTEPRNVLCAEEEVDQQECSKHKPWGRYNLVEGGITLKNTQTDATPLLSQLLIHGHIYSRL